MRSLRRTRSRDARPSVEACQEIVETPLGLLVELGARRLVRLFLLTPSAPLPDPDREHDRATEHAGDRQPPREQIEALVRRRGQDPLAEVRDEFGLDLLR